ncbi:uncharacterized protein LOC110112152 [Dendrobium catenatum]|uniref:uncharacterized protein LOC110112152 n=1 Tax=Dendrobium catenatum TaxID=906689 RepID=UPI0009F5C73C|nr:uncharacterized protein LOC110112152 [Dendrobium catenatum]
MACGPIGIRRSSLRNSYALAHTFLSSPTVFGDGKIGFIQGAKAMVKVGKPLINNEVVFLSSKKNDIEVIVKVRNVVMEDNTNIKIKLGNFHYYEILDEDDRNLLKKEFSIEEVDVVIKRSGNYTATGSNGITYSIIKAYWDFWNAVNHFFETAYMNSKWKEALILLIPMVSNSLAPSNFMPISLFNTVYKVAAKVHMNRMSSITPRLIPEKQVAFLKGGSLSDHVLVAQEIIH